MILEMILITLTTNPKSRRGGSSDLFPKVIEEQDHLLKRLKVIGVVVVDVDVTLEQPGIIWRPRDDAIGASVIR